MSAHETIKLKDCIWVRGEINDVQAGAAGERRSLHKLGMRVETIKHRRDHAGLARLRKILWASDNHVVLSRLAHLELNALYPIFKDRGNFSVVVCDWWSVPCWFTENARYQLYNFYSFFSVRSGMAPFARFGDVPLMTWPANSHWYTLFMTVVRFGSLALWPALELLKWWQKRKQPFHPERMIYFPLAMEKEDVPLEKVEIKYDFSSLGGVSGLWLMRDPFVPSYFTGANFYADRRKIINLMVKCDKGPFQIYDVRRENRFVPWKEYCQIARESRFTLATGGFHEAAVPKFIEFACLGTPMIGRRLPFEYPWLDQCLFPFELAAINSHNIRAKLDEALSVYPRLRENCLNLREQLLRQYSFENVLQMAQDQIEGKPVPEGYLTSAARLNSPCPPPETS